MSQPATPPQTPPSPPPLSWRQRMRQRGRRFRDWYTRVDWSRHTMVVATLLAAGGLLISALGTLKTNAVADTQLTQAREQEDSEAKQQVARITFWPLASEYAFVVANRSLDSASVWLYVDMNGTKYSRYWPLGIVPPCSSARISNLNVTKGAAPWPVTKLLIVDANGRAWLRTPSGVLSRTTPPQELPNSVTGVNGVVDGKTFGPDGAPVKWSNIAPCGDSK